MSQLQKTLDSLQPYVIGIRYVEGTPVVDVVFKEGWTVPEDSLVKKAKGDESMNYYMLFSDSPKIGLDELLTYVDKTIKLNQEREKKHELLRAKVNELKELFKNNSLQKLTRLKFTFTEEDLLPSLNDFDLDDETIEDYEEEMVTEEAPKQIMTEQPVAYLDEDGNPIEMSEEEKELLEEERRAEQNLKILNSKKKEGSKVKFSNKVELPPKKQLAVASEDYSNYDCDCGPDEACEKCIDSK